MRQKTFFDTIWTPYEEKVFENMRLELAQKAYTCQHCDAKKTVVWEQETQSWKCHACGRLDRTRMRKMRQECLKK